MFNRNNKFAGPGAIILVVLVVLAIIGFAQRGDAVATTTEGTCVPSDAWTEIIEHPAVTHEEQVFDHWQRYSWTGGPHEPDSPPPFPSSDWQPNVKGDPHDIGVEGAYFRSNGNSGKGDWFYLESVEKTVVVVDQEAWTETIDHPAVTCPETPTETPTTPTETPTTPVETPSIPTSTVTPSVPTEMPTTVPEIDEPIEICGITIPQAEPGEVIMRDVLCPMPGGEDGKKNKSDASPKSHATLVECVDGTWVTTVDGEIIATSGSCDEATVTSQVAVIAQEEGL